MAGCAAGQNDVKNFVFRCKISICPRPFSQAFYLRGLNNYVYGENMLCEAKQNQQIFTHK